MSAPRLPDRWYTDTEPCRKFPVWSRANAGEVYPGPISPLAGTALFYTAGEQGWRAANEIATMDPDEWDPSPNNLIASFGGYCYLNMSIARLFGVRVPGMTPALVDQQYFGDLGDIPSYEDEARPTDESPVHTARLAEWIQAEVFGRSELPELAEDRAAVEAVVASRPDLATVDGPELVDYFRSHDDLYRDLFCRHILNSASLGLAIGTVNGICTAVGRPDLTMTLLAAVGDVDSAAPSYLMWDLSRLVRRSPPLTAAFDSGVDDDLLDRITELDDEGAKEFVAGFAELIDRYGSRGPNEWELSTDVWETSPAIVMAAIDVIRAAGDAEAPPAQAAKLEHAADQAGATVRSLLEDTDDETRAQFETALRAARLYGVARERSKTTCIHLLHQLRLTARELGRRAVEAGHLDRVHQVFMITDHELDAFLTEPGAFTEIARRRETEYAILHDLEPPFFVVGDPPPLPDFPRRDAHVAPPVEVGDRLAGIPGCSGAHTGRARVVLDPGDPRGLEPGDVLIAPVTDPAWTPLFMPAGAVVVDVGAQITHAVIVSRELGLPCVVSVTDASKRIPDGAVVTVDGSAGTVTIDALP